MRRGSWKERERINTGEGNSVVGQLVSQEDPRQTTQSRKADQRWEGGPVTLGGEEGKTLGPPRAGKQ